jgi:hypothetical protein
MHDHDPVADGPGGWPSAPVGSLRVWDAGVLWRDVETAPGVYDFSRLDAIVDTAEKHHADVLIVLGQTPPFHAVRPKAKGFYGPGAASPPTLESWTAYVTALAQRYAGRPLVYQVWNEPNIKGFWKGTPAEMARLTKAAYDVLGSLTPRPMLVAPAFVTRLIGQRAWMSSYFREQVDGVPVASFVDAAALQLYPDSSGTPETTMELLAAVKATLAGFGVDKPIWNTEVNYGLTGAAVDPAPVERQVDNVARTLMLNAAAGVKRVYWYGWDQQGNVDTLLTEPDGATPSAAGRAYVTVRSWLLDSLLQACSADPAGTLVCQLQRADSVRRVYWSDAPFPAPVTVPEGASGYQRADGTVVRTPPGSTVLVGTEPLMIESPS